MSVLALVLQPWLRGRLSAGSHLRNDTLSAIDGDERDGRGALPSITGLIEIILTPSVICFLGAGGYMQPNTEPNSYRRNNKCISGLTEERGARHGRSIGKDFCAVGVIKRCFG